MFSLSYVEYINRCKDYMDYLKRYHKDKEAEIEQTKKLFNEHQQQMQTQEISDKKGTEVEEKKCDSGTESLMNQQQQKSTNKRPRTRSMSRASLTNDEESGISVDEGSSCSTTPLDRTSIFVDDKDKSNMTNSSNNNVGEGIVVDGGMVEEKNADDDDQSVAASTASSTAAVIVRGLRSLKQVKKRIRVDHCSTSNSSINLSPPLTAGEGMTKNYKNTNITNTNKEGGSRSYNVGTSIVTASTSHHGKKLKRRGFHYDYREVFLKSNVPQFIATLSGRIVVCE